MEVQCVLSRISQGCYNGADEYLGKPKDPGIPNNFPFKEQILAEVAEQRRKVCLFMIDFRTLF
jgi:hypothetical protein